MSTQERTVVVIIAADQSQDLTIGLCLRRIARDVRVLARVAGGRAGQFFRTCAKGYQFTNQQWTRNR